MQAGKFLKDIKRADQNKAVPGEFFLKINKRAGQIPIHMEENKRADQNKAVQEGFFLKINKRACMSIQHTRVSRDQLPQWKLLVLVNLK